MRIALIRCGLTAGTALFLAVAFVAPGGAQSTQEVTISYSAQADTAALELDLGGGALTLSAATTGSEVTSDGPSASGLGQVIEGDDSTRSATDAPPDESADATAAAQSLADPGNLFALDIAAGESSSESEAEDGTPSTANAATVGDLLLTEGTSGAFPFSVSVTALDSDSRAKANNSPMASASGSATGAVIDVQVDASQLTAAVCDALGQIPVVGGQLETECDNLVGGAPQGLQDFLSATIADGEVECTWADSKPAADGSAQLVDLSVLGQPVPIEIGEEVTIAGGTPLESTIGAGAFSKTVQNGGVEEEDTATARASGAFLELFGQQIVLNLGDATCGVAGLVESAEVIARTGGEILPVLFGGAALAGAGYGLRRFLKR